MNNLGERDYVDLFGFRLIWSEGFFNSLFCKNLEKRHDYLSGLYDEKILNLFKEINKTRPVNKTRIEPLAYKTILNTDYKNITRKNINGLCSNHKGECGFIYFNRSLTDLHFLYSIKHNYIQIYCFCGTWDRKIKEVQENSLIGFITIKRNTTIFELVSNIKTSSIFDYYRLHSKEESTISEVLLKKEITKRKISEIELNELLDLSKFSCLNNLCFSYEGNKEVIDSFIYEQEEKLFEFIGEDLMSKLGNVLFALSTLIYAKLDENNIKYLRSIPLKSNKKDTKYIRCFNTIYYDLKVEDRMNDGVTYVEAFSENV